MTEFDSAAIQARAGQDFCFASELESGVLWGVCTDGHGNEARTNSFSLCDWIKRLGWTDIFKQCENMSSIEPGRVIDDLLAPHIRETLGEGVCIVMFRVTDYNISFWWRGDVVGRVYLGNGLLVSTSPHSAQSQREAGRVRGIQPSWQVKVLNDTQITMVPASRANLNPAYGRPDLDPVDHVCEDMCAVYNCLGHKGWSRGAWGELVVPRDGSRPMTIVCASDGVWDMLSDAETESLPTAGYNAPELAGLAAARWRQTWQYLWAGHVHLEQQDIDSADDVCCVVVKLPPVNNTD